MNIKEIINSKNSLIGSEVCIEAFLVSGNGETYLVESHEHISSTNRIQLAHQEIESLMFRYVPALGGGPYSYLENCVIQGYLKEQNGKIQLTQLNKLSIMQDGEFFDVKFTNHV